MEISRAENLKRSIADKGMQSDVGKNHRDNQGHRFGKVQHSLEGLDLGKPWRASEDPEHDCQINGCRRGSHNIKVTR